MTAAKISMKADSSLGVPVSHYTASPPSGSSEYAIVLLPDEEGYTSWASQCMADNFAANGYFVVVPNIFTVRTSYPQSWDHCNEMILRRLIRDMKLSGSRRIAGVGDGNMAKYVVRALQPGLLAAGFVARPRNLSTKDLLVANKPLSIVFEGAISCSLFLVLLPR